MLLCATKPARAQEAAPEPAQASPDSAERDATPSFGAVARIRPRPVPAQTLSAPETQVLRSGLGDSFNAVEAFPGLMQNGWRELREELSARRPLAGDAMVKIERCKV